ncbi:MAG: UvrD-helicase domain-containing protein [Vicinamibacterales bacterium]
MIIQDSRKLISTALDDTMIVEAAAGTGKTTELVGRIVRLIETRRARIGEIVAVTFSEKAAGELKLRVREELERARARHGEGAPESALLVQAVHDFEDAHVNTIHGFCAELLRDRPVEARVDPAFVVLTESQADAIFEEAFSGWLQDALAHPGEGVRRSLRRPVRWQSDDEEQNGPIVRLRRAADELREWRDHAAAWKRPVYDRAADIASLVDHVRRVAALTATPLKKGDYFYQDTARIRRVSFEIERLRRIGNADLDGWEAALVQLADDRDLARVRKGSGTAFAAGVSRQEAHDALAELLRSLAAFRDTADADLAALLHEELRGCLDRYEQRKQSAGALDFLDLLIKARNLVRDQPAVRKRFRDRFQVILVDEFQDTDPLQAELLLLLASEDGTKLRKGALFIVGDPKQSIYRFRRADVGGYRRISEQMSGQGAVAVTLQTSFRSVPSIQRFVNAAFRDEMTGQDETLQAKYVSMQPSRDDVPTQPSIVALPVPRPYGRREVTLTALAESQPSAIAEFVRWLIADSKWTVDVPEQDRRGGSLEPPANQGDPNQPPLKLRRSAEALAQAEASAKAEGSPLRTRRRIVASDVCLLFRRFVHFGGDVTRPYVEALEARGVPHLLVGGKTFHEREEVDAVRVALTAIEWPEDELSVYATLHGPLFSIGEEELLEYHAIQHVFHPYRVPEGLPDRLAPIGRALTTLRELHAARNHRPVADTIGRLLASTRAHAGFILWRGGEQVLANVLHISDLARRYEGEGGLSFRGFVDRLREASGRAEAPEAPILEEGSEGVRLMTVHKAKGLEFPIVILADIGCKLSQADASRHLDSARGLCAVRIGGWAPLDLLEHNDEEARRDEAEGVRLAYVASTRARDVLVVPAIGDGPYQKGWVRPLNRALYPPVATRQSPEAARGCPKFTGKDTVLVRPDGQQPDGSTIRPGAYELADAATGERYTVVWWDPVLLDAPADDPRGLRREDLISKEALPSEVAADRDRYDQWRASREAAQQSGATPSISIITVSEWAASSMNPSEPPSTSLNLDPDSVVVEDAGAFGVEASGRRFGTLVHALLAVVPLTASSEDVAELARIHARVLTASDTERDAAANMVSRVLQHPRLDEARAATAAGRTCRREAPVSIVLDGALIDGQIDLAYETANGWVVVDFKTDVELGGHEEMYKRQVALYALAVSRATGQPARGVLLRS